jgi:hypothetical protein
MITTTVIWPYGLAPDEEQRTALNTMASTLAPDFDSSLIFAPDAGPDSGGSIIVNRKWPTREIAQSWVDYVLANFDVSSAVVDPE